MTYQDIVGAAKVAAQTGNYAAVAEMLRQETAHSGPTSPTTIAIAEVLTDFGVGIA